MENTPERIRRINEELNALPRGYISKKVIRGKERHYLQWLEDGKLRSRYIKDTEYDSIVTMVERRKSLQAELKSIRETPEGIRDIKSKRKEARNMTEITGQLMLEDRVIATVRNGEIVDSDDTYLPLYLKRTEDVEGWLASRAIDAHRTNSRLLKKALRLRMTDDVHTALAVNAATVTDRYWFRPEGSQAGWEDIRFKENYFDNLALRGDPDGFSHRPSRTPELTNIGSFEKCWRLIDGVWWMYKSGDENEYFSELFISVLGEKLGFDMAHYEMDGKYIRTRDFTHGKNVNFEPASAIMGTNEDYSDCFDAISGISPRLAEQYLRIIWLDTICYNMDRHTENFGFLRSVESGEIISMAPNYDNNIALISRGYPSSADRENDGFIRFFSDLLEKNAAAVRLLEKMRLPEITEEMIDGCLDAIPIKADGEFIRRFILNGQRIVRENVRSEVRGIKKGKTRGNELTL